jgi:WbqC-like protein family
MRKSVLDDPPRRKDTAFGSVMTKTVAIIQSNYLPWRGYFDIIRRCDLFIIGDTVQYTTRDWRNRNSIKTPTGKRWITIPVHNAPQTTTMIADVQVADAGWTTRHTDILRQNYREAAAFRQVSPWLFGLLEELRDEAFLSRINIRLLREIAARLGISTPIRYSTEFVSREEQHALDKNRRTLAVCRAAGATCYLSGPAARNYLDEELLGTHGVDVAWMSYGDYPPYPQLWGPFEPNVSIVDLLFNVGDRAHDYIVPLDASGKSPHLERGIASAGP